MHQINMKIFKAKYVTYFLTVLLLLGLGYYFHKDIARLWSGSVNQFFPCSKPITYAIGNLDPRFDLTTKELLSDIQRAEKIWETPLGKQLFQYSPTGDLKINLT